MEYVALVALLLLVLAVGTVVVAAPGVANGVVEGMRRGLCVVSGQGCVELTARPCVVSSHARDETVTVHAAFIRLSDHAGLLRQTLSDGSVVVTLIDDVSAGRELGVGVEGNVDVGSLHLGSGKMAVVALLASAGAQRSWHVPDAAAATRLEARLRGPTGIGLVDHPVEAVAGFLGLDDEDDRPPPADVVTFTGGIQGIAQAHLDSALADVDLNVVGRLSDGVSWNRRTGDRTVFLRLDGGATGKIARGVLKGRLRTIDGVLAGLTFDRSGTAKELTISGVGELDRGLLGSLNVHGLTVARWSGGRAEVDARLDLTVPANLAVVREVVDPGSLSAPAPGAALRPAIALAPVLRRMSEDGRIDVRAYGASSTSGGVGVSVALGGRVGGSVAVSGDDLRLEQAWSRPPGGLWEDRVDCTGPDREAG